MKNLIKMLMFIFVIALTSCSENENSLTNGLQSEVTIDDDVKRSARTGCTITEVSTYGNQVTYSVSLQGFNNPVISWQVLSGSMSIVGSNTNQTAIVSFDVANFTGGELKVSIYEYSDPNNTYCGETLTLSQGDCPDPCTGVSGTIVETIEACYPASHPYGRYYLNYAGDNEDVTWSVNYGTITYQSGASQVHVAAASLDPFTLTATINTDGGCVKQISKVFYPCDAGSGGFGK
ncbi:MAG: hypothetical protein HWD89_11775 [Tenacibaculum sp.]|uniref:hypothetical protein n=1 Tax=Tenacibaculum sp. TaxID=1906242 RepID=UPI001813AE04|nr:hypothetical protein [Tenacibaculum sp.]NVK09724.1 hypothetical protein [Tenacibaculum sp.]